MKTVFTYLLIALFSFAFSYKTVKYLTKLKTVETCYANEMDCENEKEDTLEKDEITDIFYHLTFTHKSILLAEEMYLPIEFIVNFTSSNYSNSVYSPPEARC